VPTGILSACASAIQTRDRDAIASYVSTHRQQVAIAALDEKIVLLRVIAGGQHCMPKYEQAALDVLRSEERNGPGLASVVQSLGGSANVSRILAGLTNPNLCRIVRAALQASVANESGSLTNVSKVMADNAIALTRKIGG